MAKFDNVKVGDKLWSSTHGWVTVTKIDGYDSEQSIGTSSGSFGRDGRYNSRDELPRLFFTEQKFHDPEPPKKKVLRLAIVKCADSKDYKQSRYFFETEKEVSKYYGAGRFIKWVSGSELEVDK